MQRIHYAGGMLLTGTAIADAVVDYAAALAARRTAASIAIPVRTDDGRTTQAHLLIGPASQLVTEPVEAGGAAEELVDEELVASLRSATVALATARPVVGPDGEPSDHDDADTDDLEWPPLR